MQPHEQALVTDYELEAEKLELMIREIWEFLYGLPEDITFLGSAVNKVAYWERFRSVDYDHYQSLIAARAPKEEIKRTRAKLQTSLLTSAYEFLLQRLQYLMEEKESRTVVIGDETCNSSNLYSSQAYLQAGLRNFTDAPYIVNNVVFGSSLHNPGLQIADWVAFAIRNWATNQNQFIIRRFNELKTKFRNYNGDPFGRGIVLIPNHRNFPETQ